MKKYNILYILLIFALTSCATKEGFVITTYKESGEKDKVYNVQKYEIESGKIRFPGGEVDESDSVKIERYIKE